MDEDNERKAKAGKAAAGSTDSDGDEDEDDDDDKFELRGVFWMSPKQVEQAKRYHHILIHDNTYRCNKFGMALGLFTSINCHGHTSLGAQCIINSETTEAYVWAYNNYLRAGERAPLVFLTDRDPAVEAAVLICFPSTTNHFWYLVPKPQPTNPMSTLHWGYFHDYAE